MHKWQTIINHSEEKLQIKFLKDWEEIIFQLEFQQKLKIKLYNFFPLTKLYTRM